MYLLFIHSFKRSCYFTGLCLFLFFLINTVSAWQQAYRQLMFSVLKQGSLSAIQVFWKSDNLLSHVNLRVLAGISKSTHPQAESSLCHSKLNKQINEIDLKNKGKKKLSSAISTIIHVHCENQKPGHHSCLFIYPTIPGWKKSPKPTKSYLPRRLTLAPQGFLLWLWQRPFYLSCHLNNCHRPLIRLCMVTFLKGKDPVRWDRKTMRTWALWQGA